MTKGYSTEHDHSLSEADTETISMSVREDLEFENSEVSNEYSH